MCIRLNSAQKGDGGDMKLTAQQVPHSSVVGSGVMVLEDNGPCVAMIHISCHKPLPAETQKSLSELITKAINQMGDAA